MFFCCFFTIFGSLTYILMYSTTVGSAAPQIPTAGGSLAEIRTRDRVTEWQVCYQLSHHTSFFLFFWIFAPIGHIDTVFPVRVLYPEPCTRLYEIPMYHHSSTAQSILLPVGSGLQDPQRLWVRPA